MDHFVTIHNEYKNENERNKNRIRNLNYERKQKETNQEAFRDKKNQTEQKNKDKQRASNPEAFKAHQNQEKQESRDKQRASNPEAFKAHQNQEKQESRDKQKENTDEKVRRNNFCRAVTFGPIFICSCCRRRLYENGVTKISSKFKEKLEEKKPGFYHYCIPYEVHVDIVLDGSDAKSGFYICSTCKTSMTNLKIPAMAMVNGLQLTKMEQKGHLTELENNLIAQNINFQYIFCLK